MAKSHTWRIDAGREWCSLRFDGFRRVPLILQQQIADCGYACLAMVAGYHGCALTLAELRRRFGSGATGCTVAELSRIANVLHLRSRPLRLEVEQVRKLQLPCILHWNLDHFVVLERIGRRGVAIVDPAIGRRRLPWTEVARRFTGIAIEVSRSPAFRRRRRRPQLRLRDLWDRSAGLLSGLVQLALLSLLLQAITVSVPMLGQAAVDSAVANADHDLLSIITVAFAVLVVFQALFEWLRAWLNVVLSQTLSFRLRGSLVQHLLQLPLSFFERRHVGDVISRIESLGPIERLISTATVAALIDGALSIVVGALLFAYSPFLACCVLSVTAFYLVARLAAHPVHRRLTEEAIAANAIQNSLLLESLRAIQSVKAFGRETARHVVWLDALQHAMNTGTRVLKFGVGIAALSRAVFGMLEVVVLGVGASQVIDGKMTLGMLFAFQAYRAQFAMRADALIDGVLAYRVAALHVDRLAEITAERTDPVAPPKTAAIVRRGSIRFEDASFAYTEVGVPVLRGINLHISPAERVALVGPSGGGKSTLLKAVIGLCVLQKGRLVVDGTPIDEAALTTLRREVGVVMQGDRLLSGTLADNIAFFSATPDQEQVERVARVACIHDDISRMPLGYLSRVGDMGASLSAGQQQRVLLARALYPRPRLLLLDEGTANLDPLCERALLHSLAQLPITQIIVAHRRAAIAACERTLLVADGGCRELCVA